MKDNGGAAFPVAGLSGLPNNEWIEPLGGMSLRQYYAAHAPDVPHWFECGDMQASVRWFTWRWHYADAMIKCDAK